MITSELQRAVQRDGRSNRAIARAAGLCHNTVRRFKNGARVPTFAGLTRIAGVLGYEVVLRRMVKDDKAQGPVTPASDGG